MPWLSASSDFLEILLINHYILLQHHCSSRRELCSPRTHYRVGFKLINVRAVRVLKSYRRGSVARRGHTYGTTGSLQKWFWKQLQYWCSQRPLSGTENDLEMLRFEPLIFLTFSIGSQIRSGRGKRRLNMTRPVEPPGQSLIIETSTNEILLETPY